MSDKRYNGWANYETWAFALWFDNEEPLYRERVIMGTHFFEEAEADGCITKSDRARIDFTEWLEAWAEENRPDLGASLWSDLLGAAISGIDFREIADNWLSEIDDYERSAA